MLLRGFISLKFLHSPFTNMLSFTQNCFLLLCVLLYLVVHLLIATNAKIPKGNQKLLTEMVKNTFQNTLLCIKSLLKISPTIEGTLLESPPVPHSAPLFIVFVINEDIRRDPLSLHSRRILLFVLLLRLSFIQSSLPYSAPASVLLLLCLYCVFCSQSRIKSF